MKTDWTSIYILTIVTFLGLFKIAAVNSATLWAYMKLIDPTVNTTFLGFINSVSSSTNLVMSFIAGVISDRLGDTKPCIIAGKCLWIVAIFSYFAIEVVPEQHKVSIIIMEMCFGFSMGLMSVSRTTMAMSSTVEDRPKAMSISSLAASSGIALGPALVLPCTLIPYPGIALAFGLHFNVYTAPMYIILGTTIVSIVLLVGWLDGTMKTVETSEVTVLAGSQDVLSGTQDTLNSTRGVLSSTQTTQSVDSTQVEYFTNGTAGTTSENGIVPAEHYRTVQNRRKRHGRFDKFAVFLCCLTRIAQSSTMLFMVNIGGPYMMTAFGWTSQQLITYNSMFHTLVGVLCAVVSISYLLNIAQRYITDRQAIVSSVFLSLLYYLITYPYSFLPNTIPYQVLDDNGTVIQPGCELKYKWCATTPQVNVYVYMTAKLVCFGIGMSLMMLNLDLLYSKILGNIRQGKMQGLFLISGDVFTIIGPTILT
ncbi:unnamed protein product [Bursaphelenchus okinawaensis]|uniref:MFS domain-containing protein n=1 Tax=Bursaphelenchus okinawaensis TaxID=465554 RepID=A0A811L6G0_9BILA|nr:unnamed protein product [Bursaphelenchus okinawaensis]CAG9117465.1 unnamed protein product [Bursaphelenchus okinawaensis]